MTKKYLFFIFALILSISMLTGCGGGGGGGDSHDSKLFGTWYLNYDNGKPVLPDSEDFDTIIFYENGKFVGEDSDGRRELKWVSSGDTITVTDNNNDSLSIKYDVTGNTLTLNFVDEGISETSIYKRTKYEQNNNNNNNNNQNYDPQLVGLWGIKIYDGVPIAKNSDDYGTVNLKANGECVFEDNFGQFTEKWSTSNDTLTLIDKDDTCIIRYQITDNGNTLNWYYTETQVTVVLEKINSNGGTTTGGSSSTSTNSGSSSSSPIYTSGGSSSSAPINKTKTIYNCNKL